MEKAHELALKRAAAALKGVDNSIGERPWQRRFTEAEEFAKVTGVARHCFGAEEWVANVRAVIHIANAS